MVPRIEFRTAFVLVVDDEPGCAELVASTPASPGPEIPTAAGPEEALRIFAERHPAVIVTDPVRLNVLQRIMDASAGPDVTAHDFPKDAAEAMRRGASDYLTKPLPIARLRRSVSRILDEPPPGDTASLEGMVGASLPMRRLYAGIRTLAPHYQTLLITGETGTGKELVARAVHNLSPVAAGRYVVLNCSAVVETLFESELFGHAKGSFTGAAQDKAGLAEHAHGGTLFLDEIGDMPLGTQARLLRVLQSREVRREGEVKARSVDIRVIAATNLDLRRAVASGRFREDLYYRLSMVEIHVPALAERREDLPLLERHFLARFASQYGKQPAKLSAQARSLLARHSWPGNVRELENALGFAAMMTPGGVIGEADLPDSLRHPGVRVTPADGADLKEGERTLVSHALSEAGGNLSKAARTLGIGRDALRYRLKKYCIARRP